MKIIDLIPECPARPADAHKGTFGTVVVVGGCPTMIGAPALCASAALRAGAGLAKIASDPAMIPFMLTIEPGATGMDIAAISDEKAVLAVGPGLGRSASAEAAVRQLLRDDRPMVLDADGLNLFAKMVNSPRGNGPLVMTPHLGEFRRLAEAAGITESPTYPDERLEGAAKLARAHRAVVVLKGQHSVVTDGERAYVNQTGNPAMATGGSGDVLTGVIAALVAQGMEPFEAAALGVYLHGLAGDLWCKAHGPSGMTARDLAGLLPAAFEAHRNRH